MMLSLAFVALANGSNEHDQHESGIIKPSSAIEIEVVVPC